MRSRLGQRAKAPKRRSATARADSIGRRLQQHRRRFAPRSLECVLVEVDSKSAARELEALTIRRLKELGLGRVRNVIKG